MRMNSEIETPELEGGSFLVLNVRVTAKKGQRV